MSAGADIVNTLLESDDDFDPKDATLRLTRKLVRLSNILVPLKHNAMKVTQIDEPTQRHPFYTVHGECLNGNPSKIRRMLHSYAAKWQIPIRRVRSEKLRDASEKEPWSTFSYSFDIPDAEVIIRESDIDPKEYALSKIQPKTVYYNIVFMQGDDAHEALEILDEMGQLAALEHLKLWDYGKENEHTPVHSAPWGEDDRTFRASAGANEEYIMSWNHGLGYIGLTRSKKYIYGLLN